jgi:hypothetical protein
VDPRTGLDAVEKRKFFNLAGLQLRPLSHPACSQSLYRLRYPGFLAWGGDGDKIDDGNNKRSLYVRTFRTCKYTRFCNERIISLETSQIFRNVFSVIRLIFRIIGTFPEHK